jgi:uncharacterized phage protein (TIGR01671 family)
MREIEFRGKRKDNGEWVCGYYVQADNKHYIFTGITGLSQVTPVHHLMYEDFVRYEVIPETVGEYTGLLDKNKKRIFEGDILKSEFNSHSIIVTWSDRDAGFKFMQGAIPFKPSVSLRASVIGNIHDTPSLLDWNKIEEETE